MSLLSISGGLRRAVLILASAGLAATIAFWYLTIRTPSNPRRTLRIGFEQVPPVQIRTDSGFAGLAVETVNEAAKRAGLSLKWVETGTSSDEALRRGLVDLWPIMIDLPDRRKRVHITKPWLHTSHTLVLRAGSAILDSGFGGRIAVLTLPIHVRLLSGTFPQAHMVQLADAQEVVKTVCRGTVAAGFLEDRAALHALREKPAECGSTALRLQTLPNLTLQLGIGSTFEAAGAADRIRAEIGSLFRDGTLAATIAKYSYYGLDDTWTTYALMEAAERARWIAWSIAGLGMAMAVTVWQAASLRQRKRSEAAVRESDERFRAIFSQAAVGVAQLSLEGKVEFANDCYCTVIGHAKENLQGNGTVEFTHREDLQAELPMLRQLLAGEIQSYSMEKRYERKDGTFIWARICKSLARDRDNRPNHIIAIVEDITERKQAEEALRENEQRLVSIYNTVQDVIFHLAVEPEGQFRFVSVNAAFLRVTGLSLEGVIGKTVNEVIPEPSLTMVLGKYRKAVEENTTVRWEETSDYSTGRLTGVVSVAPVFDNKGTCTHLVGSVHDITERKRAEDAVRESERRFDELAEQSRTTTWEVDSQGLFTYVSHVSESVWGYHPDELVGRMHFYDMHPETGREAFKTAVFAVTERKQPFHNVVHAVETKDVRLVWGSTNGMPLLNADGTLKGYRGSCTDITERKRAEEILKASEEKYRALVETTDTGYLITDKEGKVIDANREYVRLTGHSELGEILGRSVIEWTAAHEKQRNAEALARCVKDGFIRDLVIDYVDGSNRVTPVEINAKVTGSGESLRTISLCRDISDRKRAEEVRLQLQLAEAQKMESIGRLAGGVAHDFNNLLTVINGYAAFLSKELVVQDPLRTYALEIGEAGKRAASLTSQLLAFSRKRAIMPKAVDVNAVVADAERMLQRLIGEDIELVSSLAPHLGLVMADPDQMHQIILNLAVNARDAMPNGGRFEITTAEVELDETAAAAHPDATPGCYVRLTVTDTGTGMTEEVQQKIFEPFFTTKGPGKGTGLGLAMVYGAVRQHDGWIEVKSKLGRGSTFRIHLPCIDAGVAVDEAKLAATNAVRGDETVLVVEDQEAVRRLTKTILEEHGYRVLEAASGAEAHAVAREHAGKIDLLLTDVVMPGMDGRTLSGQLRDLRPNLRVILMSGYAGDLTAHEGALASGLAYIQKPFVPEELATKVRGVLDSPV